jgi:hypothetical protein
MEKALDGNTWSGTAFAAVRGVQNHEAAILVVQDPSRACEHRRPPFAESRFSFRCVTRRIVQLGPAGFKLLRSGR